MWFGRRPLVAVGTRFYHRYVVERQKQERCFAAALQTQEQCYVVVLQEQERWFVVAHQKKEGEPVKDIDWGSSVRVHNADGLEVQRRYFAQCVS